MGTRFQFDIQREQSAIKTDITLSYFDAWSKVMTKADRIAYIDLYSGPGIFDDGKKSTPILILEYILQHESLCNKVITIFNDIDEEYVGKLKHNIQNIDNINKLKYPPIIKNEEIGENTTKYFKDLDLIPCFSFIDPAGYKGLSLELLRALGKDFGSDLLFFFNYNDITRGVNNDLVKSHMRSLFGEEHYELLRGKLENSDTPDFREAAIVNEMAEALKDVGLKYVLPFRFKMEKKDRKSHYLVFVSKHFLGFNIMKSIMTGKGEQELNGVGKFEFIPSCDKECKQLTIIDLYNSTLDELKQHLIRSYRGKYILFKDLYEEDSPTNRYLEKVKFGRFAPSLGCQTPLQTY